MGSRYQWEYQMEMEGGSTMSSSTVCKFIKDTCRVFILGFLPCAALYINPTLGWYLVAFVSLSMIAVALYQSVAKRK